MDRHLHNDHQAITSDVLNRISTMTDKRLNDEVLHRLLRSATSGSLLADTESAFMPGADALAQLEVVTGTGGNRDSGWGMKITVGLGFRQMSAAEQPLVDLPRFQAMFGAVEKTFSTSNSDVTDPRMDHVYMKPKITDGNSSTVKIIDPVAPNNITSDSRDINAAADYDYSYEVGTPHAGAAGGSGAPSAPSGYVDNDLVCKILVLAGSGNIEDSEIDDQRDLFEIDSDLVPGVTSLAASAITVSPTVEGEADAQSALEALETAIAAASQTGINIGVLEPINTTSVRIAPGLGDVVKIDCDGTVLSQNTNLVFDITSDIHGPAEAADTAYFLYVYDNAGSIAVKISSVAPHDTQDTKPGYHPTETTWRCVGEVMNDASSNIAPFTNSQGVTMYTGSKGDEHTGLVTGTATSAEWALIALRMPETSPYAILRHYVRSSLRWACIGQSDASIAMPTEAIGYSALPADVIHAMGSYYSLDASQHEQEVESFVLPIADRSNPGFKHAMTRSQAIAANLHANQLFLIGFYDPWSSRMQ